jgi:putative toxin-antitoxin system antitoxin component (TIGR02293 family)
MATEIELLKPKSRSKGIKRASTKGTAVTVTPTGGLALTVTASKRRPGARVCVLLSKDPSSLQAYELVADGLQVASEHGRILLADVRPVGISTYGLKESSQLIDRSKLTRRRAKNTAKRLAAVTKQAINVLGSREAAERWLSTPAIGLDQRLPIKLLQSSEGTELVKTLLTRMDYGVYA